MVFTLAFAVALAQPAVPEPPEPDDGFSSHVLLNIRSALRGATSAALVTVKAVQKKRVQLVVNEGVVGAFPAELDVAAAAFNRRDLAPGTQLLAFFRGAAPTGHYELSWEGRIREYPLEAYLQRTRYEHARAQKLKPAPRPPPAVTSARPVRLTGS